MWSLPRVSEPVTFVVFGATGDLFTRKIIPSLYLLHTQHKLPKVFSVIGFGRQPLTTDSFRERIFTQMGTVVPGITRNEAKTFLDLFEYHRGEFNDSESFISLGTALRKRDAECNCSTIKSFYLAVPPELVRTLAPHISEVVPSDVHLRRIIVEKPFGKDEASARELNAYLHQFFDEAEIFRIDHYLAKPALDTLLHARTKHRRYDTLLNQEPIRGISVTLFETLGVEKRGAFYDTVGTFRDVGQNHLLEMLALSIMPIPNMDAAHVCRARVAFMERLPRLSKEHVVRNTIRAQHEGYRLIEGVHPDSETETYFRVSFELSAEPFAGIPVTLQSGKRMHEVKKDIAIYFDCEHTDSLHVELEPSPRIYTQKDGHKTIIAEFVDPEPNIQYANEYASLFVYAWQNDPTFFPAEKEVEYMWRFTDPIVKTWATGTPPLQTYTPGAVLPWKTDI